MPMLTADRLTPSMRAGVVSVPVAANTTIFAGALVALDLTTGMAVPASPAANRVILGVARRRVVNTGAAGSRRVECQYGVAFKFNTSGTPITSTHFGRVVYLVDDNTVTIDLTTHRVKVGKIVGIDPDGVWVYIPYPGIAIGVEGLTIDGTYDANEQTVLASLRLQHNTYDV